MDRNNLFIFLKKKNKTKIHFSPFISASGQNSRCQAQITISAPRTLKKAIGTRNIWRRSTSKRIHLACYPPEKNAKSPRWDLRRSTKLPTFQHRWTRFCFSCRKFSSILRSAPSSETRKKVSSRQPSDDETNERVVRSHQRHLRNPPILTCSAEKAQNTHRLTVDILKALRRPKRPAAVRYVCEPPPFPPLLLVKISKKLL